RPINCSTEKSKASPRSRRFLSGGRRLCGDRVSRPGNVLLKSVLFFLPTQTKQTPWARCIKERAHAQTVSNWLCSKIQGRSVLGGPVPGGRRNGQATPLLETPGQGFENDESQGPGETGGDPEADQRGGDRVGRSRRHGEAVC